MAKSLKEITAEADRLEARVKELQAQNEANRRTYEDFRSDWLKETPVEKENAEAAKETVLFIAVMISLIAASASFVLLMLSPWIFACWLLRCIFGG